MCHCYIGGSRWLFSFIVFVFSTDYSEDRLIALLNSELADTLGNLVQRVTAEKLHPTNENQGERLETSDQLNSDWSEICQDTEDKALFDHLIHLTGVYN